MRTSGRSTADAFPLSFADRLQYKLQGQGLVTSRRCRTPPGDFMKRAQETEAGLLQMKRTLVLSQAPNFCKKHLGKNQRALPVVQRNLFPEGVNDDSLDDLVETNMAAAADDRVNSTLDVGIVTSVNNSLRTRADEQAKIDENKNENEAEDELCKYVIKQMLFT